VLISQLLANDAYDTCARGPSLVAIYLALWATNWLFCSRTLWSLLPTLQVPIYELSNRILASHFMRQRVNLSPTILKGHMKILMEKLERLCCLISPDQNG